MAKSKIKEGPASVLFDAVNVLLLAVIVIMTVYPILYVIFASFSNGDRLLAHSGLLWKPLGFTLDAYKVVMKNDKIFTGFANTLFLIVVKGSMSMLLTIIGAYVLSRKDAMLVPAAMFLIVVTMFFSGGLIPTYLNVRSFGLDNKIWALVFPTVITPFNMIILRNAFSAVPGEIGEAASIDGAGSVGTLFMIMLPLVVPSLMVILLYYAVDIWNSWFDAMLYLRKKALYPLQLVLREILINNNTSSMGGNMASAGGDNETMAESVQYAVMMVATVPILLVYPFLQRYFVNGIMVGAVKG